MVFLISFFYFVVNMQAVKPNMRSFLHTVQKNQMLMMTPNTLGRTGVIKSFIKHTTPLRIDPKVSFTLNSGQSSNICIISAEHFMLIACLRIPVVCIHKTKKECML